MEVVNREVNPPIRVIGKLTQSLHHWSSNTYVDPEDNVAFEREDLTTVELGHVYHWKITTGRWVLVHMPYKVMDSYTGKLVQGLKSFKSVSPYINGTLPEKHLKSPKSCIQDFRLSMDDFRVFERRVLRAEGIVFKDEVDTELLSKRIRSLKSNIEDLTNRLNSFREHACLVSTGKYYESSEDVNKVIDKFRSFRSEEEAIHEFAVSIVIEIDKLSKETSRETDKVRINEEFDSAKPLLSEFRNLPIDRYQREAIHKSRVDLDGLSVEGNVPSHIRSLQLEINELKAYYPCLSRLRVVSNTEVALDLTGVDISISDKTVIVRGDPGALKAYMSENTSSDDDLSSRRVRNILNSGSPKK